MSLQPLSALLAQTPLFQGLPAEDLELIAGCASNVKFDAGDFLFREGGPADTFYLVRHGNVSIEFFAPGRGPVTIQTRGEGEVIGWSWLFPPYTWSHDARAFELTRALAFNADCLRGKCDKDPRLGYELMKRFGQIVHERLEATRLQLLDLYGGDRDPAPRGRTAAKR
ncbi:MAG TPA: Crp/Fnr family transcriptional regulator [Acidobacteria bacterium]|nr:Crp/Fnr family transcriptional regulator [Acidobacteriota bacterium]